MGYQACADQMISGGMKDVMLYLVGWFILSLPAVGLSYGLGRRWWNRMAEDQRQVRLSLMDFITLIVLLLPGVIMIGFGHLFVGVIVCVYLLLGGALGWIFVRYRAVAGPAASVAWMASGVLLYVLLGVLVAVLFIGFFALLHEGFFYRP
jgi:hypothetical protein